MADAMEALRALVERNTTYLPDGFSVDVAGEAAAWDRCLRALGPDRAYARMAELLCDGYRERFGAPFLFTETCVAWELKYHIDAYLAVSGFRGYRRHPSTLLYSPDALKLHCRAVDVSTEDVRDLKQRLMFRYKKGVRPCWRGTERDPFRK